MQNLSTNTRAGLSALATGILVFLFWDVMSNAVEPMDTVLRAHDWGKFAELSVLGIAGFVGGLMSLVYYEAWMKRRAGRRSSPLVGPGAAAVDEFAARRQLDLANPAIRLAFLIAIGIGVHNFGEGLAIGQAAASNEISLAVTLIIGFGLHNATEGFGICGPLSGEGIVPSWRLILVLGLIGGGPTFLGTVVGQAWTSDAISVVFFTVAGGSILYVVQELFAVNRKYGHPVLIMWLLLVGVLLGFATDFVVTAAGV
jgi:zinc transporter, ZIP family